MHHSLRDRELATGTLALEKLKLFKANLKYDTQVSVLLARQKRKKESFKNLNDAVRNLFKIV